ncbi:hypothetical protein F5Y16DRAFT_397708 [Xylariaceae sp. FL0255]|nr:hypothetical protein F5Y16DRAFT_397708 [Xylariaceae sp. FL0255]
MIYGGNFNALGSPISRPGSPPGMSCSRSSKASSLQSFTSEPPDDTPIDHFEEIGLDDDAADSINYPKPRPNPYSATFASDLRAASAKHIGAPRNLSHPRLQQRSPNAPAVPTQFRDTSTQSLTTLDVSRQPLPSSRNQRQNLSIRSASLTSASRRHRTPSPNTLPRSLSPRDPNVPFRPRRSSWQANQETRNRFNVEKEYDDSNEDDDIPDGLILDNVPLSPRPPSERSSSRPVSASTSPERRPKERVRSVGNGTPPVAADRGSLRSPSWKSEHSTDTTPSSPTKGRAKSWTAAISSLNAEAKALTEKLEEHADDLERRSMQQVAYPRPPAKPRVQSALAELPPLRRTNIMIDPLPVSKEKEAVLSRTRPSWLPPKNPAEEKRHLKEYQKMMANSIELDKKREAARREKEQAQATLAKIWEQDVLERWDAAIHESRTRDLLWKGVAPRLRGAVWSRATGNQLGLTETSFEVALSRARDVEERVKNGNATAEDERRVAWFSRIQADVEERTWRDLKIFQAGAPLHQSVVDVLRAYAMYRSDIGYVNGCNTIAALLLLNLDNPAPAFIALANILNRPLPLSFYSGDQGARSSVYDLVRRLLAVKSPALHKHLAGETLSPVFDMFLDNIFMTLCTQHLSLDDCSRVWDVYVFEGDEILIRTSAAFLLEREMSLLSSQTSNEVQSILTQSPKLGSQDKDDVFIGRVRNVGT